ncbi:hypothetical protein ACFY5D_11140 [Paeniglutamicibacter sp. NPDC012692]|uniref:hypothetical protein n=1 Tax=Paeniglutamicibacter sp. NPDC012692 TaxID=3364388 RepID=UPI00368417E1
MSIGLTACSPLTQPNGAGTIEPPSESAQSPSESPQPPAPLVPLVWADGTKLTFNERSLDDAREATKDDDFTEVFSTFDMQTDKTAFVPLGVEPSGTPVGLHGTRLSEEDFEESGNRIDPESMQIGRYVGKSFEPFTTSGALKKKYIPRGVSSISVTDTGITWSENDTMDDGTPGWRILGVSPGTTDVRILAAQTPVDGPGSGFDVQQVSAPLFVDERVYWNFFRPHDDDGSMVLKILSANFKNPTAVREELGPDGAGRESDGENVYIWGDGLASVAEVQDDSDHGISQTISAYIPGEKQREILHLENSEEVLSGDAGRMQLRGSDGQVLSVVFGGDLFLVDPDSRQTEMFRGPRDSWVVGVTHCGTRISWTYAQEPEFMPTERYVFDRDSNELSVVPGAQPDGSGWCSGDYIGWSPGDPEIGGVNTWDVITRWIR